MLDIKLLIKFLCAAAALGCFGPARAAPSTADGNRLYAPCVVCHQPSARGSTDGVIPNLAGQKKHYLMRQLTVFRSRAGDDTAMRIVAIHSTFSDARNIAAVADYLSDLDANPRPVIGSGDHLPVGQELYEHICAACHGDDGQGRPGNGAPRIGGQHYPYLRHQIELASEFHKEVAPPEMTTAIRSLRTPEKDALADYISRLARCKHGDSTRSMPPTAPEGSSLGDALDLQGVSTAAPSKRPARRSSSA